MEVSDQLHAQAATAPGTHWIGGLVVTDKKLSTFSLPSGLDLLAVSSFRLTGSQEK